MILKTILSVWCCMQFPSVCICHEAEDSNSLCDMSVQFGGATICFWLVSTKQNARSSEAKCNLDNGTIANVPSEDVLSETTDFVTQRLGTESYVYMEYGQATQGSISSLATGQPWVPWDSANGQPNGQEECAALYSLTGKFHDVKCSDDLYVLFATLSQTDGICEVDHGSLAYIPNDDILLETTALATQQLGSFHFAYVGYRKNSQSGITIQGTNDVQSWVPWDSSYGEPDNVADKCIAVFTATGKFHDAPCTELMHALCSTPYIAAEVTTDVSTTGITTDAATSTSTVNDPTTFLTTDVNAYANVTNVATCNCDCNGSNNIVINPIVNITKELQAKLDTLKKETQVNEELLSSTIRARTSARDPRPSSAYVGYFGIVLLTTIFGGLVLLDLPRAITTLKKLCSFDT